MSALTAAEVRRLREIEARLDTVGALGGWRLTGIRVEHAKHLDEVAVMDTLAELYEHAPEDIRALLQMVRRLTSSSE